MQIIIIFFIIFCKECRSFNTLKKNGRFEEESEQAEEVGEEERKSRKKRRKRKRKWVWWDLDGVVIKDHENERVGG